MNFSCFSCICSSFVCLLYCLLFLTLIGQSRANCVDGSWSPENVAHCTSSNPCTNLFLTYNFMGVTMIDDAPTHGSDVVCKTNFLTPQPERRDDGAVRATTVDGQKRYFCASNSDVGNVLAAASAPTSNAGRQAKPLYIFLHGTGGKANGLYSDSSLRQLADSFQWQSGAKGYHIVFTQAFPRHWPYTGDHDATKWDFLFRNLEKNEDVRLLDQIIDRLVESGDVDRKFLLGGKKENRFFFFVAEIFSCLQTTMYSEKNLCWRIVEWMFFCKLLFNGAIYQADGWRQSCRGISQLLVQRSVHVCDCDCR
jgi:hypothetical protein